MLESRQRECRGGDSSGDIGLVRRWVNKGSSSRGCLEDKGDGVGLRWIVETAGQTSEGHGHHKGEDPTHRKVGIKLADGTQARVTYCKIV